MAPNTRGVLGMMTAQPSPRRDPWRFAWQIATSDVALAIVALALSLYLLLLTLIPQIPSSPLASDPWLAQVQARFGAATSTLYRAGLFSLTHTPLPRLILIPDLGGD